MGKEDGDIPVRFNTSLVLFGVAASCVLALASCSDSKDSSSDTKDSGGTSSGQSGKASAGSGSAGADAGGGSGGSGGPHACQSDTNDAACLSCTKSSCCNELVACADANPSCGCALECISTLADPTESALMDCAGNCGVGHEAKAQLFAVASCWQQCPTCPVVDEMTGPAGGQGGASSGTSAGAGHGGAG
jgi:hypothetical protein